MTDNTQTETLTTEKAVERFVNLFREIDCLNADIKSLAEEADEANLDVPTIKAVAKLLAAEKAEAWTDKTTKVLDMLEAIVDPVNFEGTTEG